MWEQIMLNNKCILQTSKNKRLNNKFKNQWKEIIFAKETKRKKLSHKGKKN